MPAAEPLSHAARARRRGEVIRALRAGADRWETAQRFGLAHKTVKEIAQRAGLFQRTGYRRPRTEIPF